MNCIVFVCEFIELESCLVAPDTQNSELVLSQTICQMVKIDLTTLKILIDAFEWSACA